MKIGDEIKFCGYDWYIINQYKDNVVLMMKDILSEEEINKYIKNDPIMVNGSYVRYNDNIRYNQWELSYIYKILNGEFLRQNKELAENIIEIRLPKKEEIEELDYEIRKASDWYWTCTPYESSNEHYIKSVWRVGTTGDLDYGSVFYGCGSVRPAVVLKSSTLESVEEEDKTSFADEEKEMDKRGKGALEEIRTKTDYTIKDLQKYIALLMETQNQLIDIVKELRSKE